MWLKTLLGRSGNSCWRSHPGGYYRYSVSKSVSPEQATTQPTKYPGLPNKKIPNSFLVGRASPVLPYLGKGWRAYPTQLENLFLESPLLIFQNFNLH